MGDIRVVVGFSRPLLSIDSLGITTSWRKNRGAKTKEE